MTTNLQLIVLICALVIVLMAAATAITLSIKIPKPSPDLREGIRTLYWIANLGAATIIGLMVGIGA